MSEPPDGIDPRAEYVRRWWIVLDDGRPIIYHNERQAYAYARERRANVFTGHVYLDPDFAPQWQTPPAESPTRP